MPRRRVARDSLLLGHELVEDEQQCGGSVDRHRRGDLAERDPVEEDLHVGERVDRDTRAPDLAGRSGVVRVVPELRRQVERDREPGLPLLEQVAEALVRLLGRGEAGVLSDRPRPPAVHVLVRAPREGKPARKLGRQPLDILLRVDRLDLDARVGLTTVLRRGHALILLPGDARDSPPGRCSEHGRRRRPAAVRGPRRALLRSRHHRGPAGGTRRAHVPDRHAPRRGGRARDRRSRRALLRPPAQGRRLLLERGQDLLPLRRRRPHRQAQREDGQPLLPAGGARLRPPKRQQQARPRAGAPSGPQDRRAR